MKTITLFLLLCCYSLSATIIPIDDIDRFDNEVGELNCNSLVLFDVDYTLIMPKDVALGPRGQQFTHKLIAEYLENPAIVPPGKYPEGFLFGKVLTTTEYVHVEQNSVHLVQQLQKKGIPVLALTAAETDSLGEIESFIAFRVDQLKVLGFDFSNTFPNTDPLKLPKCSNKKQAPAFASGVLFASKHPKGDVLKLFFEKMQLSPTKVVFVDDRIDYINSVENAMNELGIECICLHYTAANKHSPELDSELAAFQFQHLAENGEWLPDEKAKAALLSRTSAN